MTKVTPDNAIILLENLANKQDVTPMEREALVVGILAIKSRQEATEKEFEKISR